MFIALRNRLNEDEDGFTLIELLVVVIIIGILAAIAIPTFLNQRQKGWDASAKSDARNAAIAQEEYFTDNNAYLAASPFDETTVGANFKPSDNITTNVTVSAVGGVPAQAFCITSKHTSSPTTWYLSSDGTLNDTAC